MEGTNHSEFKFVHIDVRDKKGPKKCKNLQKKIEEAMSGRGRKGSTKTFPGGVTVIKNYISKCKCSDRASSAAFYDSDSSSSSFTSTSSETDSSSYSSSDEDCNGKIMCDGNCIDTCSTCSSSSDDMSSCSDTDSSDSPAGIKAPKKVISRPKPKSTTKKVAALKSKITKKLANKATKSSTNNYKMSSCNGGSCATLSRPKTTKGSKVKKTKASSSNKKKTTSKVKSNNC